MMVGAFGGIVHTRVVPLLLLLLLPAAAGAAPIAISGQVSGPGGSPVSGARVLLIPIPTLAEAARLELEGKADPDPAATVSIGADGSFRLQAPEDGMWKVAVQAKGMLPQEFLLQPLLEETELPALEMERDAGLEVRVTGPDGKPAAGARVRTGEVEMRRRFFGIRPQWQTPVRAALA